MAEVAWMGNPLQGTTSWYITTNFEITINGTPYSEAEDIAAITLVAEVVNGRKSDRVSLHALSSEGRLHWLDAHLSIGDEIRIQIVEQTESTDFQATGCDFCGRPVQDVRKLVQGIEVGICDDCINAFGASLRKGTSLPLGASIHDEPEHTCGFCEKTTPDIAGAIVRNGVAICAECLRSCEEIIEDQP